MTGFFVLMISISQGIHKIKTNIGDPIEIVFVRGRGPKRGSRKRLFVLYGATIKPPKNASRRNVKKALHKHRSTLPLLDLEGKPVTPYISHIIEIDGEKVKH